MKRKHVAKMVSAVLVTTMLMGLAGCCLLYTSPSPRDRG